MKIHHSNIVTYLLVLTKVKDDSNQAIERMDVPGADDKATELQLVDRDALIINRLKELNKRHHDFNGPIIPVIVFACNRISVKNCLDDLVKYRPNSYQFPIIVSQVSYAQEYFEMNSFNDKIVCLGKKHIGSSD